MKNLVMAAGLVLAFCAGPAMAGAYFADGSLVDLCAFRDNVVNTSSGTSPGVYQPLHPVGYADARFNYDGSGTAWWEIEFSSVYNVSNYEFRTYDGLYTSFTYQIETSLDGEEWFNRTGPISQDATVYNNKGSADDPIDVWTVPGLVSGTFDAAAAKFVRFTVLESDGYNFGSTVCMAVAHLSGPNTVAITPNISLAQTAWAGGGVATLNGNENVYLNDNFQPADRYLYGAPYSASANSPAQMIVPLDDQYAVSSVGMSTITDSRRAKDVQIWVSPDAAGDNWILVTNKDGSTYTTFPDATYYVIDFSDISENASYNAQRVRIDVLNTYNGESGFVTQLYVYGAPVPEPATMTLLTLGGLTLLRRRRPA